MLIRNAAVALVLTLLATGMAAGAEARGPCAVDAKNLCYNVQPGEGRIYSCLKSRQAELAPACRDRMNGANEKLERLAKTCKPDAEKYCKGVPSGDGRILSCLKGRESDLERACARDLKRARNDRSLNR